MSKIKKILSILFIGIFLMISRGESRAANFVEENASWSEINASGPSARRGHTSVYDSSKNTMIVFGGFDGNYKNDVWKLDLDTNIWTAIDAAADSDKSVDKDGYPNGRATHTAVWTGTDMIVFGGWNHFVNDSVYRDVWILKNALGAKPQWERKGVAPTPYNYGIRAASAVWTGSKMIVFGGLRDDETVFSETMIYIPGSNLWERFSGGIDARYEHSAVYDSNSDSMYVFGGRGAGHAVRNDVWKLSNANSASNNSSWSKLIDNNAVGSPLRRAGSSGFFDNTNNQLLIFGGITAGGNLSNDVWALKISDLTWKQINPSGQMPGIRSDQGGVYDGVDDIIIFGGDKKGVGNHGDTWKLNFAPSSIPTTDPTIMDVKPVCTWSNISSVVLYWTDHAGGPDEYRYYYTKDGESEIGPISISGASLDSRGLRYKTLTTTDFDEGGMYKFRIGHSTDSHIGPLSSSIQLPMCSPTLRVVPREGTPVVDIGDDTYLTHAGVTPLKFLAFRDVDGSDTSFEEYDTTLESFTSWYDSGDPLDIIQVGNDWDGTSYCTDEAPMVNFEKSCVRNNFPPHPEGMVGTAELKAEWVTTIKLTDIVTIEFTNQTPVATDFSVSTNEDTALAINMRDYNGDGIFESYDPDTRDDGSITYSVISGPSKGALLGSDNTRTYTPNPNYNGPDSFVYKVIDKHKNESAIATVSITVNPVNDKPIAGLSIENLLGSAISSALTNEDIYYNVSGSTDADNNISEARFCWDTTPGDSDGSGQIESADCSGSWVGPYQWEVSNLAAGWNAATKKFKHSFGSTGVKGVYTEIKDSNGDSDAEGKQVTIVSPNAEPIADADVTSTNDNPAKGIDFASVTVNEDAVGGTPAVYLWGDDSEDSDGTISSFAWKCVDSDDNAVGAIGNASQSNTTFNPPDSVSSNTSYFCTLTVTDNKGLSGIDSVTVNVNNYVPGNIAPTADADVTAAAVNPPAGTDYTSLTVNENSGGVTPSVYIWGDDSRDSDGTISKYEWSCVDSLGNSAGVIANNTQSNTTFDAPDNISEIINYTCTLKVTDNKDAIGTDSVTVTVINYVVGNSAPNADNQSITVKKNTTDNTITLTGSDADGDPLTFKVISIPTYGTIKEETSSSALSGCLSGTPCVLTDATLYYTPANEYVGPDSFQFKVNDGTDDSGAATISIAVVNPCSSVYDFNSPSAAALQSPENGSVNNPGSVTLDWNVSVDPEGCNVKYNVYAGVPDELGRLPLKTPVPITNTDYLYSPGLECASKNYHWEIEAIDEAGNSSVSERRNFSTASQVSDFSLSVSPSELRVNPHDKEKSHAITLYPVCGFNSPVTISASMGNSDHLVYAFVKGGVNTGSTVTLSNNETANLYIVHIYDMNNPEADRGISFANTIKGDGGGYSHSYPTTFYINKRPNARLETQVTSTLKTSDDPPSGLNVLKVNFYDDDDAPSDAGTGEGFFNPGGRLQLFVADLSGDGIIDRCYSSVPISAECSTNPANSPLVSHPWKNDYNYDATVTYGVFDDLFDETYSWNGVEWVLDPWKSFQSVTKEATIANAPPVATAGVSRDAMWFDDISFVGGPAKFESNIEVPLGEDVKLYLSSWRGGESTPTFKAYDLNGVDSNKWEHDDLAMADDLGKAGNSGGSSQCEWDTDFNNPSFQSGMISVSDPADFRECADSNNDAKNYIETIGAFNVPGDDQIFQVLRMTDRGNKSSDEWAIIDPESPDLPNRVGIIKVNVKPKLEVVATGSGNGIVTSTPIGKPSAINCSTTGHVPAISNDCLALYGKNTLVTLEASPDAGSVLKSWNGCNVDVGNPLKCTVSMNSNKKVTALFITPTVTITPNSTILRIGQNFSFKAWYDSDGKCEDGCPEPEKEITECNSAGNPQPSCSGMAEWLSGNNGVFSFTSKGVIEGIERGIAKITVRYDHDGDADSPVVEGRSDDIRVIRYKWEER